MDTTEVNLEKLLHFLKKITDQPENSRFREKLSELIVPSANIIEDERIDSIYELCVRNIIQQQAENFYSDFKITSIKSTLIEDFIRAEKFRRENEFSDFSLAVFQQIEIIVVTLFNNDDVRDHFKEISIQPAFPNYTDKNNPNEKISIMKFFGFNNFEFNKWSFNTKLKVILYYYYFQNKPNTPITFNNVFFPINNIYLSRNQNHRGENLLSTPKQQQTISEIYSNKEKHYFKFLGVLEDFVSKINSTI